MQGAFLVRHPNGVGEDLFFFTNPDKPARHAALDEADCPIRSHCYPAADVFDIVRDRLKWVMSRRQAAIKRGNFSFAYSANNSRK
jgi:hypothetical protein